MTHLETSRERFSILISDVESWDDAKFCDPLTNSFGRDVFFCGEQGFYRSFQAFNCRRIHGSRLPSTSANKSSTRSQFERNGSVARSICATWSWVTPASVNPL